MIGGIAHGALVAVRHLWPQNSRFGEDQGRNIWRNGPRGAKAGLPLYRNESFIVQR